MHEHSLKKFFSTMTQKPRSFWSTILGKEDAAEQQPTPKAVQPLFPARPAAPAAPAIVVPSASEALAEPAAMRSPPGTHFEETNDLGAGATLVERPAFWIRQTLRLPEFFAASQASPHPLIAGTASFADDWINQWHQDSKGRLAPEVGSYFACDVVVSGQGQIWIDGQLVVTPELMPGYVRSVLGLPDKGQALFQKVSTLPRRVIDRPCVVMPGGQNIYGHFLIETLFYVLLVRRMMRGTGLRYCFLLPSSTAPWLTRIMREDLVIGEELIELYRPDAECVLLRQAILPTMVHRDNGFHPEANVLLAELMGELRPEFPPLAMPRVFMTRSGFASHSTRKCVNEAKLIDYAQTRHGFVPISMEKLNWREQIGLVANARILTGLFGSALHGALFAQPGTRVASLGLLNNVQSEIGALRGHHMAYLTKGFAMNGDFTIDEATFVRFLDEVCA